MLDNTIKRGRGRPKKIELTDDEKLEEILFKAYNISIDGNGKLKFERNGRPLTLEETTFLVWNAEGKKTKKPLSNMTMLKVERNALDKLRNGLAKYGIKHFDDVFDPKGRRCASSKYGSTDCPE